MTLEFGRIVFVPDPVQFRHFRSSPDAAIGRDLLRRGRKLSFLAMRTVQKESGELARSINVRYVPGLNPSVIVGSDRRYAKYMHEGTRPHVISAKNRRTMRFVVKGKVVYAQQVRHPGTRGSKFLTRHLAKVVND